ncbi:hypothetical protein BAU15_05005 [Enterococcus sp. JM4C]|uniref:ABC transporter ATP-binding protein n=1 Tax=Candidatus Enterococcus huntleyi TaxID=1857217 RepID=UPI0013797DB3|nr:ABC transporter ATP-binding protein [Enterococcus sp. JM4C]KAF1295116.1 hypothetical protein BAU15_05005 [Enterococcus sp. JM4C]
MLTCKNLYLRYKNQPRNALSDVTFSLNENEIVSIVGHNGAGKSTLIKAIVDLVPSEGEIRYSFDKKDLPKNVHVQMQTSIFEKGIKVKEIIELYIALYESNETVDELLDLFQIQKLKNGYLDKLSGGEKQKVSILLAVIGNPKLIIFDEITTGLDSVARRMIWDLLKKIKEERKITMVLTSHFLDEVEYLADRVLVMEEGRIIKEGTVADIVKEAFEDKRSAVFLMDSNFDYEHFPYEHSTSGNKIVLNYTKTEEKAVYGAIVNCGGFDIQLKDYSFEEAFLKTIGYTLGEKGELTHEKK